MKIGVQLPITGSSGTPEDMRALIQKVEALGFASVWLGDHIVLPADNSESSYPYMDRFGPEISNDLFPEKNFLEAMTTAAFIAGVTSSINVGIGVLILPMRNALQSAKEYATIDYLSGGRLILGVGAGWFREEFESLGVEFKDRGPKLDESIEVMKVLWSGNPSSFNGRFYDFEGVTCLPAPSKVEIWIGGHTERALLRCARLGTGWHAIELSPSEFSATSTRLSELLDIEGRKASDVTRSLATRLSLSTEDSTELKEILDAYQSAGCEHLIVYASPKRNISENLERYVRLAGYLEELGMG